MLTADQNDEASTLTKARILADKGDLRGLEDLEAHAHAGSSNAMLVLGGVHERRGPFADVRTAEAWYRTAHEANGSAFTGYLLGRLLYWQKRDKEAILLFREGAATGDGLCMYWLAVAYIQEGPTREDRASEIRRLLEQASKLGYVVATKRLAFQLMKGQYGLSGIPLGVIKYLGLLPEIFRIASKNSADPRLLVD